MRPQHDDHSMVSSGSQAPCCSETIQYHHFPTVLVERPQFVLWRYEERGGKRTKVLYQPNGRRAATNRPSEWSSLAACQEARWACIGRWDGPHYDGVGFVFSADDPFVGIDLDKCRGEQWATDLIVRFPTYTEVTPSLRGFHLIGLGCMPDGRGRRKGQVELYDRGRYFTMTGMLAAGSTAEPQDIQHLVDELIASFGRRQRVQVPWSPPSGDDATILAWAMQERGVEGAFHGKLDINDSEGDWLLLRALARRTRDRAQIDRIVRLSARMRDKWDSPRGSTTYGAWSIEQAIAETVPVDDRQQWSLGTSHA